MTQPFRRGMLSRIGISVGAPVGPQDATPEKLQELVATLRGDWK